MFLKQVGYLLPNTQIDVINSFPVVCFSEPLVSKYIVWTWVACLCAAFVKRISWGKIGLCENYLLYTLKARGKDSRVRLQLATKVGFLCQMSFLTSFFSCTGKKVCYTVSFVCCPFTGAFLHFHSPFRFLTNGITGTFFSWSIWAWGTDFKHFSPVYSCTKSCSYISVTISVELFMLLQLRLSWDIY